MKPINFKEQNTVFAENQPEYLALPAWRSSRGVVVSCWGYLLLKELRFYLQADYILVYCLLTNP